MAYWPEFGNNGRETERRVIEAPARNPASLERRNRRDSIALREPVEPETGGMCVILVTFAFYVTVEQDGIEVVETVINRAAIVAVFDQIEYPPVVLYEAGEFTVSDADAGHATALTLIRDLTSGFAARR